MDLNAVMGLVHIPPNAPYVLSGLDTLCPTLIIEGKIKLIGEYEETIGTCLVFSESAFSIYAVRVAVRAKIPGNGYVY